MQITYSDFVRLFRVERAEFEPGLEVRQDGVWIKISGDNDLLTPEERAAESEHPQGDLTKPALSLPCDLQKLKNFVEWAGLAGYVDAFVLAELVMANNAEWTAAGDKEYVSDNLRVMKQAAEQFWSNAKKGDPGTHPLNERVEEWFIKRGMSRKMAQSAATLIRPGWAHKGRKPTE